MRAKLHWNFYTILYDGSDIHKFPAVHMAVGKSVNIRAILNYNAKIVKPKQNFLISWKRQHLLNFLQHVKGRSGCGLCVGFRPNNLIIYCLASGLFDSRYIYVTGRKIRVWTLCKILLCFTLVASLVTLFSIHHHMLGIPLFFLFGYDGRFMQWYFLYRVSNYIS